MTPKSLSWLAIGFAFPLCACDEEDEKPCPDETGVICTWAGTGRAEFNGDELPLTKSSLYWPVDVTFTEDGTAYALDWNNHRVRRVVDGTFETVIGTDFVGDGDPAKADLMEPGVPGTDITLNHPTQLVELPDGDLLLFAWHNHKLRRFDPVTGLAYVMCGGQAGFEGDGGTLDTVLFNQPAGGVVAADGSLFVVDQRNQRVRKMSPDGVFETIAGNGMPGFAGDGGAPIDAQFSFPTGSNPPPAGTAAIDADGRLYVSDTLNHRVRRIDFDADQIDTVAGTGEAGFGGDGGPGDEAQLNNPRDLAVGPDGRLYIADEYNHRVRALDVDSGTIETVVGTGEPEYNGDGIPAQDAALDRPAGVAFDADGALYVSDTFNHRIRRIPLGE